MLPIVYEEECREIMHISPDIDNANEQIVPDCMRWRLMSYDELKVASQELCMAAIDALPMQTY